MNPDNENLVSELIHHGYLQTPSIIDAFKKIDRANFVLDEFKQKAYLNEALPIGSNQIISQPLIVAFMIELLEPKQNDKILEIGTGSGWQTALLSAIVGNDAEQLPIIISIENNKELIQFAENNLNKYDLIRKNIVKILNADGMKGYKQDAPYDKIISSVVIDKEVPLAWKQQLKINGKIVAPTLNSILLIDKISADEFTQKEYLGYNFNSPNIAEPGFVKIP